MVSRRDLLAGGGSLAMLGLAAGPGLAQRTDKRRPALFVYDRLVPDVAAAAGIARRQGVAVAAMSGDIGSVWLDRIEPLWRSGPQPVAGITYSGALFCVEELARSYGLACTVRSHALATAFLASLRADDAPIEADMIADQPVAWRVQPVPRDAR